MSDPNSDDFLYGPVRPHIDLRDYLNVAGVTDAQIDSVEAASVLDRVVDAQDAQAKVEGDAPDADPRPEPRPMDHPSVRRRLARQSAAAAPAQDPTLNTTTIQPARRGGDQRHANVPVNIMDALGVPIESFDNPARLERWRLEEWMNPAVNRQGKSEWVRFRVIPEILTYFGFVVGLRDANGQRVFPYMGVDDICRHALNKMCRWVNDQEPLLDRYLTPLEAVNLTRDLVNEEELRALTEANLNDLFALIRDCVEAGHMTRANELTRRCVGIIQQVATGRYYDLMMAQYDKSLRELVALFLHKYPDRAQEITEIKALTVDAKEPKEPQP